MSSPTIHVINPNSNRAMTQSFEAELGPLQRSGGPAFLCSTLEKGPFEIANDADIEAAAPLVAEAVACEVNASAFVIACYSDPGLSLARKQTSVPVFGIG
ncbi:MAG: aspartate/glutamate racemase family protein, partial [Hyphomicrobiales bacterium]